MVVSLVPEDSTEVSLRAALTAQYATVCPFLTLLGEPQALDAASAGKRVLAGVRGLPAPARRKASVKPLLPREMDDKLVPPRLSQGGVRQPRSAAGRGGPVRV
ncbi:hypothetical protein GCM10009864_71910 [Streptomyces lunalinharesii]|uniref:Uncharacterized protein n=1 Tax=Streptomyces lunalinharesii TaxID=333384 RepID=A0ABN3SYC6_9ACTN